MNPKLVFINESDSLADVYKANPAFDDSFPKELAFLFNKKNNNYVGYALFEHKKQFFKVFVLPKIINRDLSDQDRIRQFVSYLSQVHALDQADLKKVKQLPLEIANLKACADDSIQSEEIDIDDFREIKYSRLLDEIENFFRKHRATTTKAVNYSSQSIRHKLDLRKNVTSLDKSRIYQNRKEIVLYSELAKVAYAALRLFLKYKEDLLANTKYCELRQKASSLSVFLAQKFKVPRGYRLQLQALTGTTVSKLFTKNSANKSVYLNILTLFGLERFWDDDRADIRLDIKGEYFFFRPEKVFELLVDEYFSKEFREGIYQTGSQVRDSYPTYEVNGSGIYSNASKPDTIASFDDGIVIIDAKWKILKLNEDSPFSAPDLLKLERDYRVRMGLTDQVELFLAYPRVLGNDKSFPIIFETAYNDADKFTFKVVEISFEFDNNG